MGRAAEEPDRPDEPVRGYHPRTLHIFTTATYVDDKGEASTLPVDCEYVEFELGPGTVLKVHLDMERFCRQPSYQLPWDR